ncbi:MAG: hypothetical protein AB9915_02900 [Candidatus Dojkabacteria bacterium]
MSIENYIEAPIIELESLAVQGSNKGRPHEILVPPFVTDRMLKNATLCLDSLEKKFPDNPLGISLHTGMVVDLSTLDESNVPITSLDMPEATSLKGAFVDKLVQFKIKPEDFLKRIGYAINCNLGITKESAEKNRIKKIEEFRNLDLDEFNKDPFVRIAHTTPQEVDRFLTNIPRGWRVALEYTTETNISLEEYFNYISKKVKEFPNLGMSVDLTHFLEYYLFMEGVKSKDIAVNNVLSTFQNILDENPNFVLSVDINNVSTDVSKLGQTHRHILERGGLIDNRKAMEMYADSLKKTKNSGRVQIEHHPLDLNLFFTDNGIAYISEQLEPIKAE